MAIRSLIHFYYLSWLSDQYRWLHLLQPHTCISGVDSLVNLSYLNKTVHDECISMIYVLLSWENRFSVSRHETLFVDCSHLHAAFPYYSTIRQANWYVLLEIIVCTISSATRMADERVRRFKSLANLFTCYFLITPYKSEHNKIDTW